MGWLSTAESIACLGGWSTAPSPSSLQCETRLVKLGVGLAKYRFAGGVFCHCLAFGAVRQWRMDGFTKLLRDFVAVRREHMGGFTKLFGIFGIFGAIRQFGVKCGWLY